MNRAFPKSEFEQRLQRVKSAMSEKGIDILCVASPANIDYLTGYNAKSYSNLQAVVVSLDDTQPNWLGRFMDTGGAMEITYLDKAHVHHYVDSYVDAVDKHPFDAIAELIKKMGAETKRIAVEMDSFFMTPKSVEVLKAALPRATFLDGSYLVNWIRTVKSETELNYMREAGTLTDAGMKAGFAAIKAGARECDVAAEIMHAMLRGTDDIGGFPTQQMMMPTGREFTKTYHMLWSDRRYQPSTATGFEFTGSRFGYSAPLARTIYLGTPPDDFRRAADIMIEGLNALVGGLKAGMTGEEGERLWRDVAIRKGIDKNARIGYAVGLVYPPTWGEQTISLRPGETRRLQSGMAIHLIPSLMSPDWGLEISETVIIHDTHAERLSRLPQDVVVK